jgi:hypothetical protein
LQKALDLDWKICWQIANVVRMSDPIEAASHVPSPAYLKRFLAAAEGAGVSSALTEKVRGASVKFDAMVQAHASDRSEFDNMVVACSNTEAGAAAEIASRRAAFRAESNTWGIQQDVVCHTSLIRRSDIPGRLDVCNVMTKLGLRRLRPGVAMMFHGYRMIADQNVYAGASRKALDPKAVERYGTHVLPEFCSKPLPEFETISLEGGWKTVNVRSDGVGRQSAVNLCLGDISYGVPPTQTAEGQIQQFGSWIPFPTRVHLWDCLLHRPSLGDTMPDFMLFRPRPGDSVDQMTAGGLHLPVRERFVKLGSGLDAVQTPDVPRYPAMLETATEALRWNPDEFDIYRLRLEYPALGTQSRIYFTVPELKNPE